MLENVAHLFSYFTKEYWNQLLVENKKCSNLFLRNKRQRKDNRVIFFIYFHALYIKS